MIETLQALEREALQELSQIDSEGVLEQWRVKFLSRQGALPRVLEGMKDVPKDKRPAVGKQANEVKERIQNAFDLARATFADKDHGRPEDSTLPGRPMQRGALHPVNQTMDRIIAIFRRMGFSLADGPDIETEYHNFDALNTPPEHPARNEQDTFYADLQSHPQWGRMLLRTQTSTVQIRAMHQRKPPLKIVAPGRCYRRDEIDATHGVFFHQIEGLAVDRGLSLAHLKGAMEYFFKNFMGPETRVRFRPHFFPFTEPSYEVDMSRPGQKVRGKSWLEICGCGMVDPAVLSGVGIDPDEFSGFAFGMGVERIAMILHQIPDLRLFSENDIRFLGQFS